MILIYKLIDFYRQIQPLSFRPMLSALCCLFSSPGIRAFGLYIVLLFFSLFIFNCPFWSQINYLRMHRTAISTKFSANGRNTCTFSDSSREVAKVTNFGADWQNCHTAPHWHSETDRKIATQLCALITKMIHLQGAAK